MKSGKIFLLGFVIIFLAPFFLKGYFLPLDILNYFPGFNASEWMKPHNSLLSDPIFQFEPWRFYSKERLLKGEIPLWNSLNGNGSPFLANPQAAVFYPINLFYYFLSSNAASFVIPILKIYLFFIFSRIYFKNIGASKFLSIMGAILTTTSGYFTTWLLWPHTNVFLFFPLALFLTDKLVVETKIQHWWFILLSFVYLFAILGGHPETLLYVGITNFLYIIYRCWNNIRRIFYILIAITTGFLLSSFQLIPFVEYLFNSYALLQRSNPTDLHFLPLRGLVVNFLPFILGAPHLEFYKAIDPTTNFQEVIMPYVGPIVLVSAIAGFFLFKKELLFRFWMIFISGACLIVYKIWPFWLITYLPILRNSGNHRLGAFISFGLILIFVLTLDRLFKSEIRLAILRKIKIKYIFLLDLIIIIFSVFLIALLRQFTFNLADRIKSFVEVLTFHAFIMSLSTVIFFTLLFLILKFRRKKIFVYALFIPIFFQTIYLFWNYNPVTSGDDYYPETPLIKELKNLKSGTVLEVGNPTLSQDINLIYEIPHAENYDALEISTYRKAFDKAFPTKNHWGKVEGVSYDSLRKFGIKYVISDYDIRLIQVKEQPEKNIILSELTKDKSYEVTFKPKFSKLRQIRLLTANFNRLNNCQFAVSLNDSNKTIVSKKEDCKSVRDKMFYTIELSANLKPDTYYTLLISSSALKEDAISLWGDKYGQPYLELLFSDEKIKSGYRLVEQWKNIYLFEIPEIRKVDFSGDYKVLKAREEQVLLLTSSEFSLPLEIKIPNYPGWVAKIDGSFVYVEKDRTFVSVKMPAGNHTVEFLFLPLAFYIGIVISFVTFACVVIYLLREEKKQKWMGNLLNVWILWSKKRIKIPIWKHGVIVIFGLFFSTLTFVLFINLYNFQFIIPESFAINWYTVAGYPRQKDYFYFFTSFGYVSFMTCLIWLIWILKENK